MANENQGSVPRFDMRLPFWGVLIAAMTTSGAYFGQKEATNIALTEIKGDLIAVKATMARIETDRYTGSDARRDFAWRDERSTELGKRVGEMELDARRRR